MVTELEIDWPERSRYTTGGKLSKAKSAGKRYSWLSINTVNNMHPAVWREARAAWREAARRAMGFGPYGVDAVWPVRLVVRLYKTRGNLQDVGAVLEGMKPIIDGLVLKGVLPTDTPKHLCGIDVEPAVAVGLNGRCKVLVRLESVRDDTPPPVPPMQRVPGLSSLST